jgi:predicted Zn-dependent protease
MLSTSFQEYRDFLQHHRLSGDAEQTRLVRRVGHRIQRAVEDYFAGAHMPNRLDGYQWEFALVESREVNAWCMPGGKVVVYTGLLPMTQDEEGLAVVLGHEIAHAVAGHGAERMSQQLLAQMGTAALGEALSSKPDQTKQLWMGVFGAGVQVAVLLPYSRTHEREADHLGLIFMVMAGYDPNAAVAFWERMAARGGSPSELLSTHPSPESRIAEIREIIPEAMRYWKPAGERP